MSWYPLEPVDTDFFDTAPLRHRFVADFPVPAATVWESLASDESVAAWGPGVKSVRWTSPRPFGVGTTRDVTLALGAVTVRERFIRWEEGSRYSFCAVDSNRPGLRRFAEDYVVEAAGAGSRLLWTVAMEASPRLSRLDPVIGPTAWLLFGRLAKGGERHFARR
jgi:carbon monoxide dehydrogenase subunit G